MVPMVTVVHRIIVDSFVFFFFYFIHSFAGISRLQNAHFHSLSLVVSIHFFCFFFFILIRFTFICLASFSQFEATGSRQRANCLWSGEPRCSMFCLFIIYLSSVSRHRVFTFLFHVAVAVAVLDRVYRIHLCSNQIVSFVQLRCDSYSK